MKTANGTSISLMNQMFSELAIIFNQFSYVRRFHFENRRGLDITFEVNALKQSRTMMVISDLQN